MSTQFSLAIYQRANGLQPLTAAEYLTENARGAASWKPDLAESTILFTAGERRLIAPFWNLGSVKWLVPQFEAAAVRLERGEIALIRSAVIDGVEVPYLLLEPQNETVSTSLFIIPDSDIERIFPAGPWSGESARLYDYVVDHRQELLFPDMEPELRAELGDEYFSEVAIDRAFLLGALYDAARQGQELISLRAAPL